MESVSAWFRRTFADPQVALLALLLAGGLGLVLLLGRFLAPLIAGVVIAYVLASPVRALADRGLPHTLAVVVVFLGFLTLIGFALLAVVPLLSDQVTRLVLLLPDMATRLQDLLLELPERYPELVSREQVAEIAGTIRGDLLELGQRVVLVSFGQLGTLVNVGIYLILVPFVVFFLLKDRDRILAWLTRFLPAERELATRVWREVDQKIGAYVRGKVYEIAIVGAVAWAVFGWLDLEFGALLAALTGLSVLIPYIGAISVAFPVGFVALFQWGPGSELTATLAAYTILQVLDGNLLAPLLISEAVDLHPVAVIAAILVFGGIWGLWGVFFSIPLATLAAAVINAWPRATGGNPPDGD